MEPSTVPFRGLRLPRGRSLDPATWGSRHRWLLILLWVQAAGIAIEGVQSGYGIVHNALSVAAIAGFGLAATFGPRSRTARSTLVALGLFTESALVVHLADGATAAHFHYFVMVGALALYEDVVPFLAALGFTFLTHGVVGAIDPGSVYIEESSIRHPWVWAFVHTAIIAAAAVAQIALWAANERVRARLIAAERRALADRDRAAGLLREVEAAADVARSVARERDAREVVATTARELAAASWVMLAEPDAEGALRFTVGAGIALPADPRVAVDGERSGAVAAFTSANPLFVPDVARDPAISRRLAELTGAASVLFQPAISAGRVRGVLCIGWDRFLATVPEHATRAAALLADEAAVAIERAGALRELEEAATTDALTGIGNRRAWNEELAAALATAGIERRPLTIALLDLDHFKALNDEQGHQAGDRALKSCVSAWRAQLRPADVLTRLGGDEFGVLLPGCDAVLADAVRERLESVTQPVVGVSVGIAEWDGREPAERLMRRADRDLYQRKAARR